MPSSYVAAPHDQPTKQHVDVGDSLTLAGAAPDAACALQMSLRFVEMTLVGQDLPDVAVGVGRVGWPDLHVRCIRRPARYSATASSHRPSK